MKLPRQEMINALKEKDKRNIKICPKCGCVLAAKKSSYLMIATTNIMVAKNYHKCVRCGHEW